MLFLQALFKRTVRHQSHHQEDSVAFFPQVVHRDDIRVFQPGGDLGFAAEALQELGVSGQGRVQHFYCPLDVEQRLAGTVDGTETAAAELAQELIFSKFCWIGHQNPILL